MTATVLDVTTVEEFDLTPEPGCEEKLDGAACHNQAVAVLRVVQCGCSWLVCAVCQDKLARKWQAFCEDNPDSTHARSTCRMCGHGERVPMPEQPWTVVPL